jgi:uncharacterized membrane protein
VEYLDKVVMIRSALLGAATGLRSTIAPAMLSRAHTVPPAVRTVLHAAAAGELVADKLPGMPSRLEPGPLVARFVIGALAGGVLAGRDRAAAVDGAVPPSAVLVGAVLRGAVLGAAGALAGAFAGYHARRALTHGAGLPDLPVAVIEDTIAIAAARHATGSRSHYA